MSDAIDTRANIERPESERPARIEPPVPDRESTAPHWPGSATGEVDRWRQRALAAEALVQQLRRDLGKYRLRP